MTRLRMFRMAAVVALAVGLNFGFAAEEPTRQTPAAVKDPPQEKKLTVMERKLKYSQQVLTALVLKDFPGIAVGADELVACVKDATWRINDTEKYLRYSQEFTQHLEEIKKAATSKNIDGATVGYMLMTRTCVRCHEYLREPKDN